MGAYYGSIQVRSEDRETVRIALESVAKECNQKFLLGPALKGWIAIYPDGSGHVQNAAQRFRGRIFGPIRSMVDSWFCGKEWDRNILTNSCI